MITLENRLERVVIDVLIYIERAKRVQGMRESKLGWESGRGLKNGKQVCGSNDRVYMNDRHKGRPVLVVLRLDNPHAIVRVRFCKHPVEVADECAGINRSLFLEREE